MLERIKNFLKTNNDPLFKEKCFEYNNRNIMWISSFLFIEQILYGVLLSEQKSIQSITHLFSASISGLYAIVSYYLGKSHIAGKKRRHHIFMVSFGVFGFIIAIYRALFVDSGNLFMIPTVYVAVLYGFAFIFSLPPIINTFIYFVSFILLSFLLPIFHEGVPKAPFLPDLLSNTLIAWFFSIISYRRLENDFKIQQLLKKKNDELAQVAITDALTKINNRRKAEEVLKEYHLDSKISIHMNSAVILADIDFFKQVNDKNGHIIGDQVLVEFVNILSANIRKDDFLGRWGGEEFIIICQNIDVHKAVEIAEKLRKKVENHVFRNGIKITCSFGVASYNKEVNINKLIGRVDKALYKAKKLGRNKVCKI